MIANEIDEIIRTVSDERSGFITDFWIGYFDPYEMWTEEQSGDSNDYYLEYVPAEEYNKIEDKHPKLPESIKDNEVFFYFSDNYKELAEIFELPIYGVMDFQELEKKFLEKMKELEKAYQVFHSIDGFKELVRDKLTELGLDHRDFDLVLDKRETGHEHIRIQHFKFSVDECVNNLFDADEAEEFVNKVRAAEKEYSEIEGSGCVDEYTLKHLSVEEKNSFACYAYYDLGITGLQLRELNSFIYGGLDDANYKIVSRLYAQYLADKELGEEEIDEEELDL